MERGRGSDMRVRAGIESQKGAKKKGSTQFMSTVDVS